MQNILAFLLFFVVVGVYSGSVLAKQEIGTSQFVSATTTVTRNSNAAASTQHHFVETDVPEGATLLPGRGSYAFGETPVFELLIDEGYGLLNIRGCGGSLEGRRYTLAAIVADCTITVILYEIGLQQAVDFDMGELTNAGDHPWIGQPEHFVYGNDALHIRDVPTGEEGRLTLGLKGAGEFSFFAWHDANTPATALQVWLNGVVQPFAFTQDKQKHTLTLPPGDNIIEWVFQPGAAGTAAKFWLDYFAWHRAGTAGEHERYRNNNNGTITDLKTGLTWQRCSLGQVWRNGTCEGEAKQETYEAARSYAAGSYAGFNDWRLPTAEELGSLVYCHYGYRAFWPNNSFGCSVRWKSLSIDEKAFPNTSTDPFIGFWTVDRIGVERRAVFFDRGNAAMVAHESQLLARYVRGAPASYSLHYRAEQYASGAGKIKITVNDNTQLYCDVACLNYFVFGTKLVIEAIPDEGSVFGGWLGACNGTGLCQLTVDDSSAVRAVFNATSGYPEFFRDNNDGTVTDTKNNLMWVRCRYGQQYVHGTCIAPTDDRNYKLTYNNALAIAETSVFAGYTDWRLPTITELKSILQCLVPQGLPNGGVWLPDRCPNDYVGWGLNTVAFPNAFSTRGVWSSSKSSMSQHIINFYLLRAETSHVLERHETFLVRDVPASTYVLSLRLAGSGQGRVVNASPPISCAEDCNLNLTMGSTAYLTAEPARGSVFIEWEGGCTGMGLSCSVVLSQATEVIARFEKIALPVRFLISRSGGSVSAEQEESYYGEKMRYTLTPDKGYKVSKNVGGTCPVGEWLDEFTYETGAVFTACTLDFAFIKNSRKGLPFWLFAVE